MDKGEEAEVTGKERGMSCAECDVIVSGGCAICNRNCRYRTAA